MPYDPPPDIASSSLLDIARAVKSRRLPPVERWTPARTANSGMRIAADGTWLHQGSPITRPAMVRAFSTLLMRDACDRHWLMTPDCRQSIAVEDAAFRAVDMEAREGALVFRLDTDELVVAGPKHRLRAAGDTDTPAIYLGVRHGCEARLDRSTWLQLAEHALANGDGRWVASGGERFSLMPR